MYNCSCDDCKAQQTTFNLAISDKFKRLLNVGSKAFKHLHKKGSYSPEDLKTQKPYQNLIQSTFDIFNFAIQDNDMPESMQRALQSDAYLFGSLKANAQLFEASKLLLNPDGRLKPFSEVSNSFDKLNVNYNQNYLEAEYEFAVASSQMAAQWSQLGSSERYNLQYRTAQDERVRKTHEDLANTTLPKEDPFWSSYYPPNGWRCRCTAVEVLKTKYPEDNSDAAIKFGEAATTELGKDGKNRLEIFRFNPGQKQVVFPPTHPYNIMKGAKKVKIENDNNLNYKNLTQDQLKESYNNQKIKKENEDIIMNNNSGYVATTNSFDINESLRKNIKLSEENTKTVASLDKLIKENKVKTNLILYRNDGHGFIENHFKFSVKGLSNQDAIKKLKSATISKISDKGFLSTSAIKESNAFKFRKIHSEIRVKEGTNAFIPNNFLESEVILKRNQKLQIIDFIEENDKIKIIMQTMD